MGEPKRRRIIQFTPEQEAEFEKRTKDYLTTSNNSTLVSRGRRQNKHLKKRSEEGATKTADWAKDHPVLNTVGLATAAAPFAVASYPAAVVTGEAVGTALANPYVDAGLTSVFGAHGLQSLANENADWTTALEIAPLGRLAKPLYEGVVQPGMRLFNSPLTGNWTKIGNREYRLSPNSFGVNGSPIESRATSPWIKELPLDENRYYRQVMPDALDSYKATGVVSQFNKYGINPTRHEVPMFTKGKPSLYRGETKKYGDVWVVSKPGANLEWKSIKGAAVSPKYNGEFNSAPISEFEFYQYDPARGYIKFDERLNLPEGINFSRTPHIDYLNGLSEQQLIEYLTLNGLNDQWLWTLKNNPDHLEGALSEAPIPNIPQITLYSKKQGGKVYNNNSKSITTGGKMNLEFLKNGSGIHIKKKNRGKFTLYCGGKVTDACIRRAKASGNPTLIKRATFAQNSRSWSKKKKHLNGGILIINGIKI